MSERTPPLNVDLGDGLLMRTVRHERDIVAIAESHLTIHTWPEYGYAAVDIFTCGDTIVPRKAAQFLIERFQAQESSMTELQRGILSELQIATQV